MSLWWLWYMLVGSVVAMSTSTSTTTATDLDDPDRVKDVLILGGSVSWGARLDDRDSSNYANVLRRNGYRRVVNLALRATDATYPSLCLQSMLRELSETSHDEEVYQTNYDAILLEYSLNGWKDMETLVQRLRLRYPRAVLVYVHVYSVAASIAVTTDTDTDGAVETRAYDLPLTDRQDVPVDKWRWILPTTTTEAPRSMVELFRSFGGGVWSFPVPSHPHEAFRYFATDWTHLNAEGHLVVGSGLHELLSTRVLTDVTLSGQYPHDNGYGWGAGDRCHNWFSGGVVDLRYTNAAPNRLTEDGVAYLDSKTTLEFVSSSSGANDDNNNNNGGGSGGTVEVWNDLEDPQQQEKVPVPLHLIYLSTPRIYPPTSVWINDAVLSPPVTLHPSDRDRFHLAVTTEIGTAAPGRNFVHVRPLQPSEAPFRLVGVALAGFHAQQRSRPEALPVLPAKTYRYVPDDGTSPKEATVWSALRLLSLGGPRTWGHDLPPDQRTTLTYPYKLANGNVDVEDGDAPRRPLHIVHKSIRASDALHPSLCIESMLSGEERYDDFDVILLEYSSLHDDDNDNGTDNNNNNNKTSKLPRGLHTLVRRLHYRYPDALLVYVHVYSLRDILRHKGTGKRLASVSDTAVEASSKDQWEYALPYEEVNRPPRAIVELMERVNGVVVPMPVPRQPDHAMALFQGPSYRSLSALGHRVVSRALLPLFLESNLQGQRQSQGPSQPFRGSWGRGDQCLSWYESGGIQVLPVQYDGCAGPVDVGNGRWALEFCVEAGASGTSSSSPSVGGTLQFDNAAAVDVPLYLTYIVETDSHGDYNYGSTVQLNVDMNVDTSTSTATSTAVDLPSPPLNGDRFQTTLVGLAKPGHNVVRIEPHSSHDHDHYNHLRLIGISLYGTAIDLDTTRPA